MAKKSILIIDDSASMRTTISIILGSAGYDVIEAQEGAEGLAKLSIQRFNLIISDLNMPGMNGITFLKKLKEHATLRYIPVIMLTTESADEMKQQGKEAGAKAWMTKPFDPAKLLDTVSKLVQP